MYHRHKLIDLMECITSLRRKEDALSTIVFTIHETCFRGFIIAKRNTKRRGPAIAIFSTRGLGFRTTVVCVAFVKIRVALWFSQSISLLCWSPSFCYYLSSAWTCKDLTSWSIYFLIGVLPAVWFICENYSTNAVFLVVFALIRIWIWNEDLTTTLLSSTWVSVSHLTLRLD
jgi:hypothetical protein